MKGSLLAQELSQDKANSAKRSFEMKGAAKMSPDPPFAVCGHIYGVTSARVAVGQRGL